MADNDIQGSDVHGNEIQGDGSPAGVAGDDRPVIRIGTRGSELATTQAGHVRDALIRMGHEAELVIVKTEGDANRHDPVENGGPFDWAEHVVVGASLQGASAILGIVARSGAART